MQSFLPANPFQFRIMLPGMFLSGSTREVDGRRRLLDLLNSADEVVKLTAVSVTDYNGNLLAELPESAVEKAKILAAIPDETEEYQKLRRRETTGMIRRSVIPTRVVCTLPFLIAQGVVYLQPAGGTGVLRAQSESFTRFFIMTEAELLPLQENFVTNGVVILNRDAVCSICRTPNEQRQDKDLATSYFWGPALKAS
jgi:hypothetical protein